MIVKIQLVSNKDVTDIFNLSNDHIVRCNSIKQRRIQWLEHVEWFEKKCSDENSFFYSIRNEENQFVGYVRFDKHENIENGFVITIHLAEPFRGIGLGNQIVNKTTKKICEMFKDVVVYAFVKEKNIASIRCFKKAGYSILNKNEKIGNETYYVMAYGSVNDNNRQ